MLSYHSFSLLHLCNKVFLYCFFFLISQIVFSEEIIIPDKQGILVQASRKDTPVENVIASTSIITARDIEKSTATSLPELLMYEAGLNIIQAGSAGGQTSLFIRGTESNHTAILLNGQLQKISLGSVSLQYIDLEQIERIEIIRGPQSSLHGSDAIGGIINIITKKNGLGSNVHIEVGSHLSQLVSVSHAQENLHIGLSTRRSEGFDSLEPDTQNDSDGFEMNSALLGYEKKWHKNFTSIIQGNIQQGKTEYDNILYLADSTLPENHFKSHNMSIENLLQLSERQELSIKLGQARYQNEEYNNPYAIPVVGNYSIFTHDILSVKTTLQTSPELSLVIGGDLSRDNWKQKNDFDESIKNHALFSILELHKARQLVNFSARVDDNEQFGKHSTYRAAYEFRLNNAFTPFISVGTGFKAPDFDELYSPWYSPNPDLQPETSINQELGFKTRLKTGHIRVNIYRQTIEDFIAAELIDPLNFIYQLQNLEEVEISGMEIFYSFTIKRLSVNTNATYTDARNPEDDSELLRRPRRIANIRIDYDFGTQSTGSLKTGLNLHGESKRRDIGYETGADLTLPGFALVDLHLEYKLRSNSQIQFKAKNILDKEYKVTDSYNTDGTAFYLGLSHQF